MAAPVTNTGYRDGGKTSEAGIHRITRGLYTREGVILSGDLQVTQNGTPDTNVLIATGDIVIGTTSPFTTFPPYFYHSWVATAGLVAIAANASGSARIDAIVAYIDLTVTSSASNDNPGALKFMDVQGTPAGSPVAPTDAQIQAAIGASNPWVLLAVVNVANGFATIVNANITDCRPLADTSTTIDTDQSKSFVATGLLWAATSGLSAANSAGRAYLALTGGGGRAMYKPVITHLFTASKDTYVDLPPTAKATMNDDFTYTPVTNGAAAPALATGSIRLAKVVTSGAAVTSVVTSGQDSLGNQFMPRPIGTNQIELGAVALTNLSTQLQNDINTGWLSLTGSFTYNANNGLKEFVVNTPSDLSGTLSPGMKCRFTRNVVPPTQSMAFVAASTQYATKVTPTGTVSTFTGPYTAEAWVYLNSYGTSQGQYIVNRFNNAAASGGWTFFINNNGQIQMTYGTTTNFTNFVSTQSIPLKRWVHVACAVTSVLSKTGVVYINGAAVASSSPLSNSTTLTQDTVDLRVGASGATPANTYVDGFVSEVRIWNAAQTAANIQANMGINLVGNETNLMFLVQGNGNFTDTTTSANTLTATNGAIATQASNPYNAIEYAQIIAVTTTTLTLDCGTMNTIPNATLTTPNYAVVNNPTGLPSNLKKYVRSVIVCTGASMSSASMTLVPGVSIPITIPVGSPNTRVKLVLPDNTNPGGITTVKSSIWDGTVGSGRQMAQGDGTTMAVANYFSEAIAEALETPASGAHIYNGACLNTAGISTTVFGSTVIPILMSVEVDL